MSTTNMSLRDEIRTKDIWVLMAKFTPVAVLGMSINSLNMFVDALFIGQFLGETALAAMSLAFPLSFITNSFAAMLGVGGSSILSIAIGEKDKESQSKIFGTIVVLSVIVSVLLMGLGWVFAEDMIAAIGGKGEVLRLGVIYYKAIVLGAFFQIFAVATNLLIRAEGKIKEAMVIAMISMISNMILNPIFIGYLDMGIAGAAYATIISMAIFVILDIWYYSTKRASYEVDLTYYKLEKKLARPILAIGISAMMLQVMFLLQQIVVFKVISIYGDDSDIAFMGACYRVMILMLVPGFGFSSALQPIAGINFGAKDYPRVKEAFWKFTIGSTVLTTFLLILIELFPRVVLGWMLPNIVFTPADILNFRLMMSPGFMFSLFFMGIVLYQAIGNAKVAGIVLLLRELVFFLPLVIILPIYWGIQGIYVSFIFQNIIVLAITCYLIFNTFKKWKAQESQDK